ncbi:MAG: serine/threonine-protein kinase [Gemmataceae bacterium]
MRSRTTTPPASTDDLLLLLRSARLLDDAQLRRLTFAWDGSEPPAARAAELVQAGLLTRYQAERALAGRVGALRLGPYRLLEPLGGGGMGRVFKAEHVLLRRTVALKILGRSRRRAARSGRLKAVEGGRVTPGRDRPRPRTALRREIETVGTLAHPHIVTAHDACRLRGRLVLVLEYVDGVDLERFLAETGPLPVDLACEVVRQTALALDHLHARRLVHRDVKPANLMLTREGPGTGRPVVKLLDLGLACPAGRHGELLCGTPDYLPPERGLAPEYCDIRGDLYSLGCTFYQLLTGRVPFPGGGWTGKLLRHRLEEPTPVDLLRPETPPAVAAVVARLMARDPDTRYPDPAALLGDLPECRAAPTEAVNPPVAEPPPRRRSAVRPALAVLTIAAGLCLGVAARLVWSATAGATSHHEPPVARAVERAKPAARIDLPAAVAAAADGGTVLLPDGVFRLTRLDLGGKRLTLRAAPGARPRLVRVTRDDWDALLLADRDLTLDGITLDDESTDGPPTPLLGSRGGRLTLRRCQIRQRAAAPAVLARQAAQVTLEDTVVRAPVQGIAVEPPPGGRIDLKGCRLEVAEPGGVAVFVWASESARPETLPLALTGCTVNAGRVLAVRTLRGPVRVAAHGCDLHFREALVSLDGCDDARRVLRWQGIDSRYHAGRTWLRVDGEPGSDRAGRSIRTEQAWHLWNEAR